MFGIGLPEMILILALALIVVGPDKLPELARSLAKGLMELKKTAEGLKESFKEEGNPLDEIKPDLEEAAKSLKQNLLDVPSSERDRTDASSKVFPPEENAAMAYQELMKKTGDPANQDEIPKQESETKVAQSEDQTESEDSEAGTENKQDDR